MIVHALAGRAGRIVALDGAQRLGPERRRAGIRDAPRSGQRCTRFELAPELEARPLRDIGTRLRGRARGPARPLGRSGALARRKPEGPRPDRDKGLMSRGPKNARRVNGAFAGFPDIVAKFVKGGVTVAVEQDGQRRRLPDAAFEAAGATLAADDRRSRTAPPRRGARHAQRTPAGSRSARGPRCSAFLAPLRRSAFGRALRGGGPDPL